MLRTLVISALGGCTLLGSAATVAAEINIRVPFVHVRIGKGPGPTKVMVDAPFTHVRTQGPIVETPPSPLVSPLPPIPPGAEFLHAPRPAVPPVETVGPAVLTLQDFARSLNGQGGLYEVYFLHPHSKQPVCVKLNLPPGMPRRVEVDRDEIELDYGRIDVEIHFKRNGTVRVDYDD